jgi:hypothetical protein
MQARNFLGLVTAASFSFLLVASASAIGPVDKTEREIGGQAVEKVWEKADGPAFKSGVKTIVKKAIPKLGGPLVDTFVPTDAADGTWHPPLAR